MRLARGSGDRVSSRIFLFGGGGGRTPLINHTYFVLVYYFVVNGS